MQPTARQWLLARSRLIDVHKCACRGGICSCPYGANVDGRVKGADRQATAHRHAASRTAVAPAAVLAPRPQGEPAQAHEYCARQVNYGLKL